MGGAYCAVSSVVGATALLDGAAMEAVGASCDDSDAVPDSRVGALADVRMGAGLMLTRNAPIIEVGASTGCGPAGEVGWAAGACWNDATGAAAFAAGAVGVMPAEATRVGDAAAAVAARRGSAIGSSTLGADAVD